MQRAGGVLTAAVMESVKTLLELQRSPAPASVRLGAARAVIKLGLKVRAQGELEQRLAALEAAQPAPHGAGKRGRAR